MWNCAAMNFIPAIDQNCQYILPLHDFRSTMIASWGENERRKNMVARAGGCEWGMRKENAVIAHLTNLHHWTTIHQCRKKKASMYVSVCACVNKSTAHSFVGNHETIIQKQSNYKHRAENKKISVCVCVFANMFRREFGSCQIWTTMRQRQCKVFRTRFFPVGFS